ncbi:MAG: hypothetical protein H0U87_03130 [Acidobacteria bacterium]|jgi:hypothetical protein|nr:hypothetical protein [Acidobacteriota bacterium]
MCSKNFIKRIVPFFLAFAVGLFIASFFITIAAPTFRFSLGGERFRRHQEYHRMMKSEIRQLREDKARLEKQLADKEGFSTSGSDGFGVPSSAPMRTISK